VSVAFSVSPGGAPPEKEQTDNQAAGIVASACQQTPRQVARAGSLREITDADMVRGGIDLIAYLQVFWKSEIL
jgi:hypothetical protein